MFVCAHVLQFLKRLAAKWSEQLNKSHNEHILIFYNCKINISLTNMYNE